MELNVGVSRSESQVKPQEISVQGEARWAWRVISESLACNGITPHPDRVRAIKDMTPSQDINGVQRFLGMSNYFSRLTLILAEIFKPLTELTQGNAMWSWSSQHGKDFLKALSSYHKCFFQVFPSESVSSFSDSLFNLRGRGVMFL